MRVLGKVRGLVAGDFAAATASLALSSAPTAAPHTLVLFLAGEMSTAGSLFGDVTIARRFVCCSQWPSFSAT